MSNEISREVIARIRALRHLQDVSAQQLADEVTALGFPISRAVLASWETRGGKAIPVDFLVLAAQALGATATEILTQPVVYPSCKSEPPAGFTCNTCGADGGAA